MIKDFYSLTGSDLILGASMTHGITALPAQSGLIIKFVSGSTFAIGATVGGYYMSPLESVSITLAGTFYVNTSGTTCVINVLRASSE